METVAAVAIPYFEYRFPCGSSTPLSNSESQAKSLLDPLKEISHNADVATELARRAVARGRITGSPQAFGSRAHRYFEGLNRRLNARLAKEGSKFRIASEEFRDADGLVTSRNADNSIGADTVLRSIDDPNFIQIFDLKTHGGTLRPIPASRQTQFIDRFGTSAQEIYRQR
ncbi:MAG: hypothetical protein QM811_05995 [Pirellulales bacterium]